MATTRTTVLNSSLPSDKPRSASLREQLFVHLLSKIREGRLQIVLPSGLIVTVGEAELGPERMEITDTAFFGRIFSGGSVGLGEAYVDGLWTTPNLSGVLKVFARNQKHFGQSKRGFSLLTRAFNRIYHLGRKNTLSKSKENIQEHYDLSNDFYETFLDASMTYSSALFTSYYESLEQAQINKIDRMLDLAGVQPGDRILEIGSGWGALALRAAERGCSVKTITLSEEQLAYAKQRFEKSPHGDRIEIVLQDYRELKGSFDAVVSCEMIEAVGKEFLQSYFSTIRQSLKPGAKAVVQAITIPDDRYEQYSRSCDWIQKHIFPGGHLPSPAAIESHVEAAGEMNVLSMEGFGGDYAETLNRWAKEFNRNAKKIGALGFDAKFRRKWNYYLSYCEAGFDADLIDVKHVVLQRTAARSR
ncbi:MAG: cyclopropane-fatty-acyl-phospholipid synthase family protein [Verrucomicrobiota bacterium]